MLSFVLRILGLTLFAAGIVATVADGIRSIAGNGLLMTTLRESWTMIDPSSLEVVQRFLLGSPFPGLWDPVLTVILGWPTLVASLGAGVLLMILGASGRKRRTGPKLS